MVDDVVAVVVEEKEMREDDLRRILVGVATGVFNLNGRDVRLIPGARRIGNGQSGRH